MARALLVAEDRGLASGWWHGAIAQELPSSGGFQMASFRRAKHTVFVVSTLPGADVREVAQAMTQPLVRAIDGV